MSVNISKATENRVRNIIARARTSEDVWALVTDLTDNPNGYSDSIILENLRAYAAIAKEMN